jgi:hypothetical protein
MDFSMSVRAATVIFFFAGHAGTDIKINARMLTNRFICVFLSIDSGISGKRLSCGKRDDATAASCESPRCVQALAMQISLNASGAEILHLPGGPYQKASADAHIHGLALMALAGMVIEPMRPEFSSTTTMRKEPVPDRSSTERV